MDKTGKNSVYAHTDNSEINDQNKCVITIETYDRIK